ncbi:hypothetical protein D3C86_1818560 [compost metagenome]
MNDATDETNELRSSHVDVLRRQRGKAQPHSRNRQGLWRLRAVLVQDSPAADPRRPGRDRSWPKRRRALAEACFGDHPVRRGQGDGRQLRDGRVLRGR